jgi:hypothetical protein
LTANGDTGGEYVSHEIPGVADLHTGQEPDVSSGTKPPGGEHLTDTEPGEYGDAPGVPTAPALPNAAIKFVTPFHDPAFRAGLRFGAVENANFTKTLQVVVGNRANVRVNTEYLVDRVDISANSFIENLSPASKSALDDFKAKPESAAAREKFQATLAEGVPAPTEHSSDEFKVAPRVNVVTESSDIVVVGDDSKELLDADYRAPTGDLDLGQVLCQNDEAASALARHLQHPDDRDAQKDFNRRVSEAISTDVLGSLLQSADFHRDQPRVRQVGGRADFEGGIAATVGQGNTARSRITIRAKDVRLTEVSAENAMESPPDDASPPPAESAPSSGSNFGAAGEASASSVTREPHAARRNGDDATTAFGRALSFLVGLLKRSKRQDNGEEGEQ